MKFPFSTKVPVDSIEHCDDDDATLGQGEVAGEGEIGVPNGKFNATKCSWLHTILKKSNLRDIRKAPSGKVDILADICLQYAYRFTKSKKKIIYYKKHLRKLPCNIKIFH